MTDLDHLARLEELLGEAALPWSYRPCEYDDWGFIRAPEKHSDLIGPYRPVVANSRLSDVTEADMAAHRAAKTDPYERNGLLIVAAVNALPHLLSTIRAQQQALIRARSDFHLIALHSAMYAMWADAKAGRDRVHEALASLPAAPAGGGEGV